MAIRDVLKDLALNVGRAAFDTIQKAASDSLSSSDDDTGAQVDNSDQDLPRSPLHMNFSEDEAKRTELVPQTKKDIQEAQNDPKSLFWDPYAVVDALGYKDRPSPLSYGTLDAMVMRMPILQAIVQTRVSQVTSFAMPQVDRYATGFRVVQRDRKAKATKASEARSQQIERWLLATGTTNHPEARDDFETFLAKLTRDSLKYDQYTFEVVPDRKGRPAEFYAVDASTIRLADTTRLFVDPEDEEVVRYVQVYDGVVVSEYTASQLCFGIRNPNASIRLQGYGTSELEMLMSTVTSLLWSWDYNQKFFSQGASTKGILNFQGQVPEKQLKAFRRHWYSMVAGIENAWRTPIMNADQGMQWIDIQKSNKDMEFSAWFDFLIKIAASIYQMDPMEINFKYGNEGQKSMFESNNAAKLTASRDKGLKPILRNLQRRISTHLVTKLDPDFEFEFVGLDMMSANEQADLNGKLVKTMRTIDELRALEDLPPLPNGMGDLILDPTYLQHMQAAQAQAQQEKEAAQQQLDQVQGGFEDEQDPDAMGDEGTPDDETGNPPQPNQEAPPPNREPQVNPFDKSLRKSLRSKPLIIDIDV